MLRLGVIGYGDSGNDFIKAARYAEHWEAVAVGGRNMDKAAACAGKYGILALPVAEMVKRPDVDVIAISTPPGDHQAEALQVIENGKHVIVEKPMALTLEACDAIIERARAKGVQVMVSQSLQFFPGVVKAKELIDSGAIGQVLMVQEQWYYNYFSSKRVGWQIDPKLSGGGVVLNPVVHLTDRIRYLAGADVTTVDANIGYYNRENPEIEGNIQVFYRMKNGASGSILLHGYGAHSSGPLVCTVLGTEGIIYIRSWAVECELVKNDQPQIFPGETHMKKYNDPVNVSYLGHMVEWERSIRAGQPVRSPGENGRANVAVSLAIFESARIQKAVEMETFLREYYRPKK
jgi:predicted dehydrogenase